MAVDSSNIPTMSASPSPPPSPSPSPAPAPAPAPAASSPLARFQSCWSCRLLSGSALLFSAGFVYQAARRTMRLGGPTSMGTVAQIVFASGLAAWGMVVITDPVGKLSDKTKET